MPLPNNITEPANNDAQHILAAEPQAPLRTHVERVVREYFAALGDELPTDLYALILKEVELPLLTVTLEQTRGNQTKCAQILGLNRGTLRKKLKTYNLMP
ncbi:MULTISPECIES: helix-turn-helix domain-containing protein [Psychrobacter]|uniref:helix-turn-helix domain-containing protein n=1 Tax=Psychrobacter TaxID=497 RepID=UPI001918CEE6